MKKIAPPDPETRSADVVADNIAKLKTLFPEIMTEGPQGPAVNVDVLKALVGDKTVTDKALPTCGAFKTAVDSERIRTIFCHE